MNNWFNRLVILGHLRGLFSGLSVHILSYYGVPAVLIPAEMDMRTVEWTSVFFFYLSLFSPAAAGQGLVKLFAHVNKPPYPW